MNANQQTLVGTQKEMGFDYPDGYETTLTAQEVLIIQDRYLVEQLRLLNDDRAAADTKEAALEWVATPLVLQREIRFLGPLSFQRCCLEAHGADPSTLQERVLRLVAPERLTALGYE